MKGGFSKILARQGWPGVPAYSYFLWLWTEAMGTGEIALRIPSLLAMLGAAYLLYRSAQKIFDHDVAIIAAVIFCLHPVVILESIDVRPNAFGAC
jgi:mannosyltransferase